MTVKVENIEENKKKLTITVDAEKFNNALDVAFKKVSKDVEMKGFRKGKVPRNMFESKYGVESLYEEAINYLIPQVYPEAVEESGLQPVAQPQIDVDFENIGKDKPLTFYATIVIKPKVKLGDYKGIEVEDLSTEVTDEDIDNELDKLLGQHAELVLKEAEAELNDTVVIDFEGFKDGEPFEGGKAENYSLILGSNSFIPGFEEQLVGMKAGEEKTVNVTFPENYQAENLKGADAEFKVKCHEVKTKEVPALDDEFVKELNRENIETVEGLKEETKKNLLNQKETEAKNKVIDTVVDTAASNAEMTIPEEMIDAETDRMMQDTAQRLQQQGINMDMYLQYTGSTKEKLRNQLKEEAQKRIRYNLTLEEIAKEENIEITDEELQKELEKIAEMYKMSLEDVKKAIPDTAGIKEDIKMRKAVDLLVDQSVKK